MSVAFDNTFLTLLLDPTSPVRANPSTGTPTLHMPARMQTLIDDLTERDAKLIIPTPAIAEVMCRLANYDEVLTQLSQYKCIEPYAFDQKCALTLADLSHKHGKELKDARKLNNWSRQQVKVDLQIVAVALTYGADTLYTDDDGQTKFAEQCGLNVLHTWDLRISDRNNQADFLDKLDPR